MLLRVFVVLLCLELCRSQNYLATNGRDLMLNENKVFLCGIGLDWRADGSETQAEVSAVAGDGGNVVKIKVPSDAHELANHLNTLQRVLTRALEQNVLVVATLWDGEEDVVALEKLMENEEEMVEYMEVLGHVVRTVRQYPSLGAWQILRNPSALVKAGQRHSDPCLDTTTLNGQGSVSLGHVQSFINQLASTVHQADPKALVSLGVDSPSDHYTDRCLIASGGKADGTVDVYQFRVDSSNFRSQLDAMNLDGGKPVIIETTSTDCNDVTSLFNFCYERDFAGLVVDSPQCASHLRHLESDTGSDQMHFRFRLQKMVKSWGKRPTLIYNADEIWEKEQKKKEEREAKRKAKKEAILKAAEERKRKAELEELGEL